MGADGGLTSGGGQHIGETLPRRHHLWVLLVSEILPDAQRSVVWKEGEEEVQSERGEENKG